CFLVLLYGVFIVRIMIGVRCVFVVVAAFG
ncbi:hypothetical protein A2U01_0067222, partial [Trifolium medium]|nr:hypothetical protein [Trifolium medium]